MRYRLPNWSWITRDYTKHATKRGSSNGLYHCFNNPSLYSIVRNAPLIPAQNSSQEPSSSPPLASPVSLFISTSPTATYPSPPSLSCTSFSSPCSCSLISSSPVSLFCLLYSVSFAPDDCFLARSLVATFALNRNETGFVWCLEFAGRVVDKV